MSVSCGTGGFRLSVAPHCLVVGPLPRTVRCSTCGERGFEFLPISKEPPCRLPASSKACPLRGMGDRTRATLAIVATARGGGGDQAFLPACNGPGGVGMALWPSWCWAQMSCWGLLADWPLGVARRQGRSWPWPPIGNDPGTVAGIRVLSGFAVHAESITLSMIASAAARTELTGSSATATCVPDLPSDGDCTGVAGGALATGGEGHTVILRMKSSSCS